MATHNLIVMGASAGGGEAYKTPPLKQKILAGVVHGIRARRGGEGQARGSHLNPVTFFFPFASG